MDLYGKTVVFSDPLLLFFLRLYALRSRGDSRSLKSIYACLLMQQATAWMVAAKYNNITLKGDGYMSMTMAAPTWHLP